MLDIELEVRWAAERRNDWIHEAESYHLTKSAQTEQGHRTGFSSALSSRSHSILRQAFIRFLPFKTTYRLSLIHI